MPVAAGIDAIATYVDHGLRPAAARAHDAQVVTDAAARFGARVHVANVDVGHGPNVEARARDARYAALDAVRAASLDLGLFTEASAFALWARAQRAPLALAEIEPMPVMINGGKPVELLLVEDNMEEAELTLDTLREGRISNLRVHWVEDGEEAMAFLRR